MLFDSNPMTSGLHKSWTQIIKEKIPETKLCDDFEYLSAMKYINESPQKYYSKATYEKFLGFLIEAKAKGPDQLAALLKESETNINISNKTLVELNEKPIHEGLFPADQLELIDFIDKNIHYSLLKLYESGLYGFIYVICKSHLINDEKGTSKIDLFNLIQVLSKTEFSFICELYNNTMRNGIAHGKTIYTDYDIIYIDKKGNKVTEYARRVVSIFDELLDIVNGLCLALKVFCFTNLDFYSKYQIAVPQSLLIEELQTRLNAPGWKIDNCLESHSVFENKRSLTIYVTSSLWDTEQTRLYCFYTTYRLCKLTPLYDWVAIRIDSKRLYTGWGTVTFFADQFGALVQNNTEDITPYVKTMRDFFYLPPKFMVPSLFRRIRTMCNIMKIQFRLKFRKKASPYTVRETDVNVIRKGLVINNASLVINDNYKHLAEDLIKNDYRTIIKLGIKYSRKRYSPLSFRRYLPIKSIRVFVFDCDKRIRNLKNAGLSGEIIAVTGIRAYPIHDCITVRHGKYVIYWYKNWKGRKENIIKN